MTSQITNTEMDKVALFDGEWDCLNCGEGGVFSLEYIPKFCNNCGSSVKISKLRHFDPNKKETSK